MLCIKYYILMNYVLCVRHYVLYTIHFTLYIINGVVCAIYYIKFCVLNLVYYIFILHYVASF